MMPVRTCPLSDGCRPARIISLQNSVLFNPTNSSQPHQIVNPLLLSIIANLSPNTLSKIFHCPVVLWLIGAVLFSGVAANASDRVFLDEFPRDRAIFDTGAQLGLATANVPLSGTATLADGATPVADGQVIEARAYSVDDGGASSTAWTAVGETSGGGWSGSIAVPRNTSWYRAEARVQGSSAPVAQMSHRFGAGHVWAIYEQSNWSKLLDHNSNSLPNDTVTHPGDVFIFKRNGSITEVDNGGGFSPSLSALANALSAERPGEKFAIGFHTQSGTSPSDMLTMSTEDAQYGTQGKRDWEAEVVCHENLTLNGLTPVGLVTINGWIAFGAGKPSVANAMTKVFLGKDIDGTPVTPAELNSPRNMTTFYDWSYSRLGWVGPHGRDNGGQSAGNVQVFADLPGYGKPADDDYEALVDRLRSNFGQPHLPETLPTVMETIGPQRGRPNGSGGWTEILHMNGRSKDGREMLARIGMAATLKTVGLVDWPIPEFNRRYDEPTGAYVEFWMDGHDVTTWRRLRAAAGELGEYPTEIPDTFPHRTEVMGWEIDGRPAERAEIVANAGDSGHAGVRVYPNTGRPNFSRYSKIIYGPGSYVGRQIKEKDPQEGVHLNYPVVDVGQVALPALPVQPRSNVDLPWTLPPVGVAPDLVIEGQQDIGRNDHIWDNDLGGPGHPNGSFTVEIRVTLPNFTSDLILWESGSSNVAGTSFLIHNNQFALTVGDSPANYVTGTIPANLEDTEIRFVARFDTITDQVEVWINDDPVNSPRAEGSFSGITAWAADNDGDGIGTWNQSPSVRTTNAPGFEINSTSPGTTHDRLSEHDTFDGANAGDRILFKYWNQALNDLDLVESTSVAESAGPGDTEAPSAPVIESSSNITESSVDLSWFAATDNVGVTGYKVYLDGAFDHVVAGTSTTVNGLAANTTYALTVSAYDQAGNESAQSASVVIETLAGSVEPVNLALNATIFAVTAEDGNNTADRLLDGINNNGNTNRWSADGYPQSVEIDLGQISELYELKLYTFKSRAYQYTVQVKANASDSYTPVIDRSANTTNGNPITDAFPTNTIAQFVKIEVTGASGYVNGSWVSLLEAEIYGHLTPSSPQTIWAEAMGLDPSTNGGMNDDANGDGKPNFFHFALAQDPLSNRAPQEHITSELVNESMEMQLTLTFPVRVGAVFSGNPPTSAPIHNLLYTIHGDQDLVPPWGDLPVHEVTPALSSGLPALADLDGVDGPDWEYRTFTANIPNTATRGMGFMWVEVREHQ